MKSKSQNTTEKRDLLNQVKSPQEIENNYRLLFENHPLIHITISLNKIILSINKNGAKELGYEVDELIGLDI